MRIYHFGNFYLSSIQQGIQASHAVKAMQVKYEDTDKRKEVLEFNDLHKTAILLNGGNNAMLLEVETIMNMEDNTYSWTSFREDEQSLGGLLTNVAIILPEEIYETAELIRSREYKMDSNGKLSKVKPYNPNPSFGGGYNPYYKDERRVFTKFEMSLIERMNMCQLAR